MIQFHTYESADAPPARRWCCTMRVPKNDHMFSFVFGATREDAEAKARRWEIKDGKLRQAKVAQVDAENDEAI